MINLCRPQGLFQTFVGYHSTIVIRQFRDPWHKKTKKHNCFDDRNFLFLIALSTNRIKIVIILCFLFCPKSEIIQRNSGLEKLEFLVQESPCSSKQVQENIVHLIILCSSWPYEVHMFTSSCTRHFPTEISYLKVIIEINSDTAISSVFLFLQQHNNKLRTSPLVLRRL